MPVDLIADLSAPSDLSDTQQRLSLAPQRVGGIKAESYADLNMSRNRNPELLVRGKEAIRQQIFNNLSVLVGTEDFEPFVGSDVPLRIFAPVTGRNGSNQMAFQLEGDVIDSLSRNMARVINVDFANSSVEPTPEEDGYSIVVSYISLYYRFTDRYEFTIRRP